LRHAAQVDSTRARVILANAAVNRGYRAAGRTMVGGKKYLVFRLLCVGRGCREAKRGIGR